jgi:hypothetical protein
MRSHLPCFVPVLLIAAACGGRAPMRSAPAAMPMPVALPSSPGTPASAEEAVAEAVAADEGEVIQVTGSTIDRSMLNSTPTPTVIEDRSDAPLAAQAQPIATAQAGATQALPEQLVVQGSVSLQVDDPEKTASALREEVARVGGRVVSEQVDGAAESWRAQIRLRLPPAGVQSVTDWLERHGEIISKRIEASDVSRTLFDQDIALTNLTTTLERLRKLLDGGGLSMQDILGIEREMTRLRGEIERIKGEKRFLEDRVALATLDIYIGRREGAAVMNPRTKLYPGPRLAALTLFDPEGRQRTRLGAGFVVHLVIPRLTLEVDIFDDVEASADGPAEGHAVIATYGGSMYSDFLGHGQRRFFNPYLGIRLGYAHLGYSAFALQGEAGVELFKHKYVMVDAGVRATLLVGDDDVDAGLVTGASIVFAF